MPPDPPSFCVHTNVYTQVQVPGKPDQCSFASARPEVVAYFSQTVMVFRLETAQTNSAKFPKHMEAFCLRESFMIYSSQLFLLKVDNWNQEGWPSFH